MPRHLLLLLTPLALASCVELEPRAGAGRTRGGPAPAAPSPQLVVSSELRALRDENDMLRARVQDIEAQMLTVNQDVARSRQEQARELQQGHQTAGERIAALERKLEETERRLAQTDAQLAEMDKRQLARMQQMRESMLADITGILQPAASRAAGRSEPAAPGTHRVVTGDTLSTIARKHGTSTQRLMEANGITNPDQVRVGQLLKIP